MKILIRGDNLETLKALKTGTSNFCRKLIVLSAALLLCFLTPVHAMEVVLEWDANTESDLAGYKVYYKTGSSGEPYDGTDADQGPSPITVAIEQLDDPDGPQYTLFGLDTSEVYFFAVTAYDDEGLESDYSNEVASLSVTSPQDGFYVNAPNYSSYTVSGAAAAGIDVEIFAGVISLGTTAALADGTWTKDVDFSSVTEGAVSLTVKSGSTTSDAVIGTYYKSAPSIQSYPPIDYNSNTIDVTFNEDNMQNATDEANYSFSPSLNFATAGNDITNPGGSTYRLAMASIPNYTILTLTVSNITDAAGYPVMPSAVRINDNDDDDMADDWETDMDVDSPNEDPDGDGLTNVQEFNGGGTLSTDPYDSDTDNDDLPDGWEVNYGLDPLDATGVNGKEGDFDHDGFTNYQESVNGTDPADDSTSLMPFLPQVKEVIPHHNAGIGDNTRVPDNMSFCVRIEDSDGIDITDTDSIQFTINDGVQDVYYRDLSDDTVVRVVKLMENEDTQVTKLWVVYDRSGEDMLGNYPYGANINIKVDAKDRVQNRMTQASYDFNIEDSAEHYEARDTDSLPPMSDVASDAAEVKNSEHYYDTGIQVNSGNLKGAKIIYNSSESVPPTFGPTDELYPCDMADFEPIGEPVNLQPPTVFSVPVKIFIPCPGQTDVSSLSIFLYNDTSWVLACDAGGNVQPGGDAWMVPGSRVNHNNSFPATIEIKVYHFTGAQAAATSETSGAHTATSTRIQGNSAGESSGGGCFIASSAYGPPFEPYAEILKQFRDVCVKILMY